MYRLDDRLPGSDQISVIPPVTAVPNSSYDGAGNATMDKNRGISEGGIRYNILNLPREVAIGSDTLGYHYDGAGSKLRMSNTNGTVNTKYAGAFEYNNSNYLTRIATEEGQINITNNGNDYSFEYYLRDHLGNTRPGWRSSGDERSGYYGTRD
ncbi:hypothetical protein DYBT9275_02860 [Dyadobacter sp. CECT 9275]|uniref:RHS repeat-associated core domain-containing protein n=1 Tax=Dyadobacter helix TaxID=2822344 RepID=A0A916JCD7_9BACT|nr:hypothetical protein [Dyadobacter sp. CECT 9275]CAG5002294.1 hypothetical protein DYBT9275_02860 [Dyadobacter sp. CECT 9275]